jgi:hypothetical protein
MQEEETDELYLLRSVDMYKLFKRIEQLTGVTFSKQSKRELKINSRGFKLVVPDIVKMSAKVRATASFHMQCSVSRMLRNKCTYKAAAGQDHGGQGDEEGHDLGESPAQGGLCDRTSHQGQARCVRSSGASLSLFSFRVNVLTRHDHDHDDATGMTFAPGKFQENTPTGNNWHRDVATDVRYLNFANCV